MKAVWYKMLQWTLPILLLVDGALGLQRIRNQFGIQEKTKYKVKIPIVLKLYGENTGYTTESVLISRLIRSTQSLIDDDLSRMSWKDGVDYNVILFDNNEYLNYSKSIESKHTDPETSRYEIRLLHSDHESYYISPYDDKIIYVFQTDFLISRNLMCVFLRDIILENLLFHEIISYLDLPTTKKSLVGNTGGDIKSLTNSFLKALTSFHGVDQVSPYILTGPNVTVRVTFKYTNPKLRAGLDESLFEQLIRLELADYLKDFINLEVVLEFSTIGQDELGVFETLDKEGITIDLRRFHEAFDGHEVHLFVYLLEEDSTLKLISLQGEKTIVDSDQVLTVPQRAGLLTKKLHFNSREGHDHTPALNDQIHWLETLTGQFLKLFGLSQDGLFSAPKSPFIRLDFLIRRQVGLNLEQLKADGCCQSGRCDLMLSLINDHDFRKSLSLSWRLLQTCHEEKN